MSIFTRMSDIINSNINSLLDKAEDPEKMVRLIIQEMEEALVEVRSTSARAIADKKELARRQEYLANESAEWERKAEVAIGRGRDDLAKGAIAERNKAQETSEALRGQRVVFVGKLASMAASSSMRMSSCRSATTRARTNTRTLFVVLVALIAAAGLHQRVPGMSPWEPPVGAIGCRRRGVGMLCVAVATSSSGFCFSSRATFA